MSQWLTLVAAAIGVVVFLGSVVVFLRGSRDQGTIATLERSNHALTERVTVLENDAARGVIERDRLTERVAALEHENEALRAQRPSADAIAALAEVVSDNHSLLATHDRETKTMLATLILKGTEGD
jgi:hypothetical protein